MKWGADVIKIAASGGVLSEADPVDVPQLTPEEMSAIVSEAQGQAMEIVRRARTQVETEVQSARAQEPRIVDALAGEMVARALEGAA